MSDDLLCNPYVEDEVEDLVSRGDEYEGVNLCVKLVEDSVEPQFALISEDNVSVAIIPKVCFHEEGHRYCLQEVVIDDSRTRAVVLQYPKGIISVSSLLNYNRGQGGGFALAGNTLTSTAKLFQRCLVHHFSSVEAVLDYRERYERFDEIQLSVLGCKQAKRMVHYVDHQVFRDVESMILTGIMKTDVEHGHGKLCMFLRNMDDGELHPDLQELCPILHEFCVQCDALVTKGPTLEDMKHVMMKQLADEGTAFHSKLEGLLVHGVTPDEPELVEFGEVCLPLLEEIGVHLVYFEASLGSFTHKVCGKTDCIAYSERLEQYIIVDWKRSDVLRIELEGMLHKGTANFNDEVEGDDSSPFEGFQLQFIKVKDMTLSSKCYEYAFQLGSYRLLCEMHGHPMCPLVYLCLFHPMLLVPYVWVEIDLNIMMRGRGKNDVGEATVNERICQTFDDRERELKSQLEV